MCGLILHLDTHKRFFQNSPQLLHPSSTLLIAVLIFISTLFVYTTFAENLFDMGRIEDHNREIMASAQSRASQMDTWPSPLEERMKEFLDNNGVYYESQKIFYIYAEDGWIIRYYIADFYVPDKNIIIEVDGKFHDNHKQHDKMRTLEIQEQYPGVEVLRYKWKDLSNDDLMDELLWKVS